MQSERWRTCTEIFNAALERAPAERASFLQESCADDARLRAQVELLLRYHDNAGDFIAAPAFADAPELLFDDPNALVGQHFGPYRIDAVLGAGGMGVVYLACDERLGRKVGLKLLPRALVNDAAQLARLKFEARTASALNHPNIVTVHEIGQVDSTHYLAIEFIEGITLRERIGRGPVPPAEALEIVTQVASALCVAHRAGIVHRDIKPENIMIRPDGYVKVLDFGIAKSSIVPQGEPVSEAGISALWRANTQLGVILGTAHYMSPEQARAETVDARSDIWSLGVVLYETVTGTAPFAGGTPTEVRAVVLQREPPPLLESHRGSIGASDALHDIVKKCLRKNPGDRFQTSEELLDALRDCRGETVFVAWRRKGRRRTRRKITLRPVWVGAGAAALAVGVVALLLDSSSRRQRSTPPAAIEAARRADAIAGFVLARPTGVAVASDGTVYVADFADHVISRILPSGRMDVFAGARGSPGAADGFGALARFHYPADVALGRDGMIYVADSDNQMVRKITPAGAVSTWAGHAGGLGHADGPARAAKFKYPTGLAMDGADNIFIADISNHVIRKISAAGTVSTLAGAAGERGSADGAGADARFNEVHGVGVDRAGNVYAADFGNHTIRKITPDGVVATIAGQAGNPGSNDGVGTEARFCAPYSVTADAAGNLFVADTSNHTIRKITPDGVVSTFAGLAGNVGAKDGLGGEARFAIPTAVTVDNAGHVYVADFGNHAIRKITPAGLVSTLAPRTAGDNPRGNENEARPRR